jgi:hypothetical protein
MIWGWNVSFSHHLEKMERGIARKGPQNLSSYQCIYVTYFGLVFNILIKTIAILNIVTKLDGYSGTALKQK